ncbi:hypothetical protein CUR178_02795 [Leishmania enriettii]|uniref:Uncharacterized protein n=1 Tax=Leishmania enriettii TaxID=5663 RepID=A0A836FZE1_LEIEN|nr:hypothetical protein CUR178_02795 [Leishmania enriettii]
MRTVSGCCESHSISGNASIERLGTRPSQMPVCAGLDGSNEVVRHFQCSLRPPDKSCNGEPSCTALLSLSTAADDDSIELFLQRGRQAERPPSSAERYSPHTKCGRWRLDVELITRGIAENDEVFGEAPSCACVGIPAEALLENNANEVVPFSFAETGTLKALNGHLATRTTSPCAGRENLPIHKPFITRKDCHTPTASRLQEHRQSSAAANSAPALQSGVFLSLITRAGRTGLNLTGADTVMLLDGDFYPHSDARAVYRLVSPRTVEDERHSDIADPTLRLDHLVLRVRAQDAYHLGFELRTLTWALGYDLRRQQLPP